MLTKFFLGFVLNSTQYHLNCTPIAYIMLNSLAKFLVYRNNFICTRERNVFIFYRKRCHINGVSLNKPSWPSSAENIKSWMKRLYLIDYTHNTNYQHPYKLLNTMEFLTLKTLSFNTTTVYANLYNVCRLLYSSLLTIILFFKRQQKNIFDWR